MANHPQLTPEQYEIAKVRKMTPQDEAIKAGMVQLHRPNHSYPEDTRVKQLEFKIAALDSLISGLVDRIVKLEAAEMYRNLPSNKLKREADE